jgi:hypothetical protein
MLSERLASYSFSSIKNLDADLKLIEDFADALKIPNPRDNILALRQLINLIVR